MWLKWIKLILSIINLAKNYNFSMPKVVIAWLKIVMNNELKSYIVFNMIVKNNKKYIQVAHYLFATISGLLL